ncbi:twin-arginine translocation signal domain-containing protein [Streptomyces sp. NPDC056361]|uniref:twin-arginine translocation signal domain-containing protein n=1 Tax=Streptomyces sp. NPDC056361 TaxID=3345795 RepID=UPI0035E21EB9
MHDSEPLRTSRRALLKGTAAVGTSAAISPFLLASPAHARITTGDYTIRFDNGARQTILGLGFEIQSDSIGSSNDGLPSTVSGVPYDLTASERTRFYQQMLMAGRADRGFRYCRLALGLYHRGLDASRKRIVDRYPGQSSLLADMIGQAGIEGISAEYWSPAPGWKSNGSYIKGALASFAAADLDALGDAMVADLDYLSAAGVPISMWGLQNEPSFATSYSSCTYDTAQYLAAFKAVAPKIRAKYPQVMIHANSLDGWSGARGQAIKGDPAALSYVDAWTYHRIGKDSNEQIATDFTSGAVGRPVFNNEFEYLDEQTSDARTLNTAQSIMNWMTFQDAPTWFWLHALKPTTNSESPGYSLGFWRPPHDTDFSRFPDLPAGHWTFNPQNWNAVAGFVKYMPWDSVRHHVEEPVHTDGSPYRDHRIMAWKTPSGKPVFAITNRSTTTPFTYTVDTQTAATFQGHRYGPSVNNRTLASKQGPILTLTVPPLSVEFWVRTP